MCDEEPSCQGPAQRSWSDSIDLEATAERIQAGHRVGPRRSSSSNFPAFNRNLTSAAMLHLADRRCAGATDRPARWRDGVATAVAGAPNHVPAARRLGGAAAPRGTARDRYRVARPTPAPAADRACRSRRAAGVARDRRHVVSAPRSLSPGSCWPTASRRAFRGCKREAARAAVTRTGGDDRPPRRARPAARYSRWYVKARRRCRSAPRSAASCREILAYRRSGGRAPEAGDVWPTVRLWPSWHQTRAALAARTAELAGARAAGARRGAAEAQTRVARASSAASERARLERYRRVALAADGLIARQESSNATST